MNGGGAGSAVSCSTVNKLDTHDVHQKMFGAQAWYRDHGRNSSKPTLIHTGIANGAL